MVRSKQSTPRGACNSQADGRPHVKDSRLCLCLWLLLLLLLLLLLWLLLLWGPRFVLVSQHCPFPYPFSPLSPRWRVFFLVVLACRGRAQCLTK